MKVPANVCLPNLKILRLAYIKFADAGSFQRRVSNCIVLEVLVIIANRFIIIDKLCIQSLSLKKLEICQYETSIEVIINAPKLVSFYCNYEAAVGHSLSTMNSLQQARIDISEFNHAPDLTHLFQAICHVQSLRLVIWPDVVRVSLPVYDNLVELEFGFVGDDRVVWLVGFLHHTPYLKKLIMHSDNRQVYFESLPKQVPSCLLFHLKEIVLLFHDYRPVWSFDVIKFFLNHALILEIYLQASCIISFVFSILISILWFCTEPIHVFLHQDPEIPRTAALYLKCLIPDLFAYGFLQNMLRFLQTQSIVMPRVVFSFVPLEIHFGIVYSLVNKTSLGFKGAPLAASITIWISFLSLAAYVVFANKFKNTGKGFSFESFRYILTNLKLTLPSAAMLWLVPDTIFFLKLHACQQRRNQKIQEF